MINHLKLPEMLTVKETAQKVKLAPYFIRKLVLQNKVTHVHSGKKVLINFQSLLEYLNAGDFKEVNQDRNTVRKVLERKI